MFESALKAAAHLLAGVASLAMPDGIRSHTACVAQKQRGVEQHFEVQWSHYPAQVDSAQLAVILPPTGGSTLLDRWYAEKLCRQGMSTVILESWTGDDDVSEDLERHNRHFAKSERAIQFVASNFNRPVRLLGTSLGGLYSLNALARLAAVERAALITAGAPFSGIVADSGHEDLARVRRIRMQKLNLSEHGQYRSTMDQVMAPWNSLERLTPDLARTKPTLLVIGLEDEIVPTAYQKELALRLKPEMQFEIRANHFWTIVGAYWKHADTIVNFLTGTNPR